MSLKSTFHSAMQRWGFAERDSFALNVLDRKLAPYLNFRNGFFIEAGANNGLAQTNTLYFEKYQGWRGLLIEPIKELADACRRNRPNCIVENFALVPFGYPDRTIQMHYCNLMSLVKGAMKSDEADQRHLKAGCDVQEIQTREIEVPVSTLSDILTRHNIGKIDLLSLDVEGFELNVLKGLDFDRHAPRFMLIEARFRSEIDDFVKGRYDTVAELSEHDVLYRRRQ